MRALLYACTTAADCGATVNDEKLPELRRFAAARGWEVAGSFTDAIPTGTGKRPGFEALCAAAVDGGVVVANSISDLFWDLTRGFRILKELGVGERCWLVCLQEQFDSTTPAGALRLLDAMSLVDAHSRGRARTRQRVGIIQAAAKSEGLAFTGRPRRAINPLEAVAWYERGLSHREILAELRRVGSPVSKGVLEKALRNARRPAV